MLPGIRLSRPALKSPCRSPTSSGVTATDSFAIPSATNGPSARPRARPPKPKSKPEPKQSSPNKSAPPANLPRPCPVQVRAANQRRSDLAARTWLLVLLVPQSLGPLVPWSLSPSVPQSLTPLLRILHRASVGPRVGRVDGLAGHRLGQRVGHVVVRALHVGRVVRRPVVDGSVVNHVAFRADH